MTKEQKENLENMIRGVLVLLAKQPSKAELKFLEGEETTLLELMPHPDDNAIVIGARGRVARAIRSICEAASAQFMHSIIFRVVTEKKLKRRRTKVSDE